MKVHAGRYAFLALVAILVTISPRAAAQSASRPGVRPYPLSAWSNVTCGAKGRFQDREYCASPVMDQIVTDGKPAIPVLISQIADTRWIAEPVYDFWPRIRAGELAYFILQNLFLDDTWRKSTMPPLFPPEDCRNDPGWICWDRFRKKHALSELQARWAAFWKANNERIYWDPKARCFRLADPKAPSAKH
jgi:hypothetical protein